MNLQDLSFDHRPVADTVDLSHEWTTDIRHIQLLHAIGMLFSPLGRIVEIGSFKGASTMAFVSLLRAKRAADLVCVEPNPTPELKSVLAAVSGRSLIVQTYPTYGPTPDMVFIDGNHGAPALKDIEWALTRLCPIICLHDTNSVNVGYPTCWGAEQAARTLEEHRDYFTFEDKKPRDGERTERGFMVGIRMDVGDDLQLSHLRYLLDLDEKWWVRES